MSFISASPRLRRPGGAPPGHAHSGDADGHTSAGSRVRRLASGVRPELAFVLVLAAVLNLYGLGINGNANSYYSAAVHSMAQSWSSFFYGSFDVSNLMTVDKPPLALWVQTLSVRVFGFNTWAMLVPQALMGVASVGLAYDLTRRHFGRAAGFIAGLALATTPTAVAIFRFNNPDALLVLCSTLALWATVRAFESPHRTRWLALAGIAVGLGFEAKMAVALMVVPAIVAAWLWIRPLGLWRSVRQVAAFSAAAAAVGLAWPIAMWLVPASERPWISGTNDNSIWSLILGYNGLGRLVGQSGGPGGGTGGPGGGGGGNMFGGEAGPLRLLNDALGSQGGWLLGLAIGGGLAILVATRLRRRDARTGWLIAVGGTFATTAVAFSFASGIFHPYYVSALAPFTAALVGAGVTTMVGRRALGSWGTPVAATATAASTSAATPMSDDDEIDGDSSRLVRAIGGLALVAGAVTEAVVLSEADQFGWLAPVLVVATAAAGVALVALSSRRVRLAVVGVAAGLLLAAPAVWSAQTLGHASNGTFPTGGPASAGGMGGPGGMGRRGGMGGPGGGFGGPGGQTGRNGFAPPSGQSGSATGNGFPPPSGTGSSSGAGGGFAPPSGAGSSSNSGAAGGFAPPSGTAAGSGQTGTVTGSGQGTTGSTTSGRSGGMGGGGMFGGDQTAVTSAVSYARSHGGGTIAVSGQSGAAASILSSNADIAGIGGFSGRESEVSLSWFADRVESGQIRWVVTQGGGMMGGNDGRTGSTTVTTKVASTCTAVSSVSGLYDCQGKAIALRSAT